MRPDSDPQGRAAFSDDPNPPDKEKMVQAMFSSIAHRYDFNNSLLSLGRHHGWKRKAVELADLKRGMTAVDLCAGTADLAIGLARRLRAQHPETGQDPAGRIYAVDLNEPMLRLGREKIRSEGLQAWVSCLRGRAEQLQFRDASVDRVTVAFGLRNVDHVQKALEEIHRILKPGGRLVCLEFSRPTSRIMRGLYDFYSFRFLPWIGTVVSGDRTGVYRYLPASIRRFPDQEAFKHLFDKAGFQKVSCQNLSGGIVAVHVGWR